MKSVDAALANLAGDLRRILEIIASIEKADGERAACKRFSQTKALPHELSKR